MHDYARRTGVARTEFVVPEQSLAWARDCDRLRNEAELAERHKNSTVAREFEVAFPIHECLQPSRAIGGHLSAATQSIEQISTLTREADSAQGRAG